MPDIRYPGVYLAEASFASHPIDGVPTSQGTFVERALQDASRSLPGTAAPAWTDTHTHDPGMTSAQLPGCLTEMALFGPPSPFERRALRLTSPAPTTRPPSPP